MLNRYCLYLGFLLVVWFIRWLLLRNRVFINECYNIISYYFLWVNKLVGYFFCFGLGVVDVSWIYLFCSELMG